MDFPIGDVSTCRIVWLSLSTESRDVSKLECKLVMAKARSEATLILVKGPLSNIKKA